MFKDGIPEEVFDDRFEDVHAGIEALLIESVGVEVGGRMHMGRSRNDEVATCIRIKLRDDLLKHMAALLKVREVLVAISEKHMDTVMPGFHSPPACPAHHPCPPPPRLRADVPPGISTGSKMPMCG